MLPDSLAKEINRLRGTRSPEFYALVLAVHNAGWSFQDIGTALGITRSAVNQWHKAALKKGIAPLERHIPSPPPKLLGTPRKIRPDIPSSERQHVLDTTKKAGKNRRWSTPDSPERQAVQELERLIRYHVIERGVPVSRFARRAGVSTRAITQRLEKIKK